jgi:hypothetical protein
MMRDFIAANAVEQACSGIVQLGGLIVFVLGNIVCMALFGNVSVSCDEGTPRTRGMPSQRVVVGKAVFSIHVSEVE